MGQPLEPRRRRQQGIEMLGHCSGSLPLSPIVVLACSSCFSPSPGPPHDTDPVESDASNCNPTRQCGLVCCPAGQACDPTARTCASRASCDPLAQTGCPATSGCYFDSSSGGYVCVSPPGTGAGGAACARDADCARGFGCYDDIYSQCSPFCDDLESPCPMPMKCVDRAAFGICVNP